MHIAMARGEHTCPGRDIMCNMPDMIRLHILTLIPRKCAARTSVLSSKWKDLWKQRYPYSTTLMFGRPTESEEEQHELAGEIQESMRSHGEKKIEEFKLSFYPGSKHEEMVTEWIQQAVRNGVEVLHLDLSQGRPGICQFKAVAKGMSRRLELKEDIFECNKDITSLSLKFCSLHQSFEFRNFTRLEVLNLNQVDISDAVLEKLVANCHTIKHLELMHLASIEEFEITNAWNKLEKLVVANCKWSKFVISAPMLRTLHYFGWGADRIVVREKMPFLNDVILYTAFFSSTKACDAQPLIWLDHIEVLTLHGLSLWDMFGKGKATGNITFNRLKELQLLVHEQTYRNPSNIGTFFRHFNFSPFERLFIELPAHHVRCKKRKFKEPSNCTTLEHLKVIVIKNFKGDLKEIILLDFLLRHACNVEDITLVLPLDHHVTTSDFHSLARNVMQRPRASSRARMSIHCDQKYFTEEAAHSYAIEMYDKEYKLYKGDDDDL